MRATGEANERAMRARSEADERAMRAPAEGHRSHMEDLLPPGDHPVCVSLSPRRIRAIQSG